MSRSQFILGVALLCVSGALAFVVTYSGGMESGRTTGLQNGNQADNNSRLQRRNALRQPLASLRSRKTPEFDSTNYEITVSDLRLTPLASTIEKVSLGKLERMTDRYRLSPNQRRSIFPLLVSHHPDFVDGLVINGVTGRHPTSASLATDVFPVLDVVQQEAFQNDILADDRWWGEILAQLREDLDGALESGEEEIIVDLPPENILPTSDRPSRSNGEAIENNPIDFGELFGQ